MARRSRAPENEILRGYIRPAAVGASGPAGAADPQAVHTHVKQNSLARLGLSF